MTIVSKGYGGSGQYVDTVDAAVWSPHSGAAPHVISGLGVSVTSQVNRTVQLATGSAQGHGIYDQVTAAETLTLDSAAVTTNPRWDAIVLHRDWEDTTGPSKGRTTARVVKGTVNSATPVYPATLANNPGVAVDFVRALVPVLNTGAGTPVDVSVFTPGSPLYWPRTSGDGLDPAQFGYGQAVWKYQPWGGDLLIRRGGVGSEAFDSLLGPPFQPFQLTSGISAVNGSNMPGATRLGNRVILAGIAIRNGGARFAAGGGTDGNYSIGNIPASLLSGLTNFRTVCTSSEAANVTLTINPTAGPNVQATIYGSSCARINLEGLSFRV